MNLIFILAFENGMGLFKTMTSDEVNLFQNSKLQNHFFRGIKRYCESYFLVKEHLRSFFDESTSQTTANRLWAYRAASRLIVHRHCIHQPNRLYRTYLQIHAISPTFPCLIKMYLSIDLRIYVIISGL